MTHQSCIRMPHHSFCAGILFRVWKQGCDSKSIHATVVTVDLLRKRCRLDIFYSSMNNTLQRLAEGFCKHAIHGSTRVIVDKRFLVHPVYATAPVRSTGYRDISMIIQSKVDASLSRNSSQRLQDHGHQFLFCTHTHTQYQITS